MTKLVGTYVENGYAHWAPYVINGDASGLDDEDQAACDAWLANEKHAPIDVRDGDEFTTNVPGLPGTSAEYVFPVYEGDYPDGPQFWERV